MEKFIEVERARELILGDVQGSLPLEKVDILSALGRTLGEDVLADRDLPPQDNSAMDGYGVRSVDCAGAGPENPVRLEVAAEIPAGSSWSGKLPAGAAVRIMTGAPVPAGVDAVIRREFVEELGDAVILREPVACGNDIRRAGEDVRAGAKVLEAGIRITPAAVGMLAAVGMPFVAVVRKVRIGVLATGDEIIDFHEPPGPGLIRNSNSYSMAALARQAGAVPQIFPITPDRPEVIRRALEDAVSGNDIVITSGGVSMGDYDFLQEVIAGLPGGEIIFWQVRMKPGKPLLYSRIMGKPVIGLPGNPVSTMVSFEQFVRPLVRKLSGRSGEELLLPRENAILEAALPAAGGRRHYARGIARRGADGRLRVRSTGAQGSGILNSMVRGNCLIVQPPGQSFAAGDEVVVELLDY
jgi:molybdopterin molybdotransferase